MATGDRKDPYRGFNFRLEIDGITRAGFRECSGLDAVSSNERIRTQDIQAEDEARKITGINKVGDITLKRGLTNDRGLWDWFNSVTHGKPQPKSGAIIVADESGDKEKIRWNFVEGWPTKWTGPTFNADANEVAIETLEISHEGLVLD